MTKLLETIKCKDGEISHVDYHQDRVDKSRAKLGYTDKLFLHVEAPKIGLYRCRIVYAKNIEKIEYIKYKKKDIKRFKLVFSDINYELKYQNRDELNALSELKGDSDEIIIVKDNLVTDTSIANICFYDGTKWLTPKTPLLNGTTRQRLLDTKKIFLADINYKDIPKYSKIALINTMIDFDIIENAIIS